MNSEPKIIKVTPEKLAKILALLHLHLPQELFTIVEGVFQTYAFVVTTLENKTLSIAKLLKILFGKKTEKLKKPASRGGSDSPPPGGGSDSPPPGGSSDSPPPREDSDSPLPGGGSDSPPPGGGAIKPPPKDEPEKKNHGRNSLDRFTFNHIIYVTHQNCKPGDLCPECKRGILYFYQPQTIVTIEGHPLLEATAWSIEGLRCNACQKIFRATVPQEVQTQPKANFAAKVLVCLMKYQLGVPLYRQEQAQKILGIPISDAEMGEWSKEVAKTLEPVHKIFMQIAANADCIYHDDTAVKILSLMKENEKIREKEQSGETKRNSERKGMYTTAIVADTGSHMITLYFSGRKNAGENLDDLLDLRSKDLPKPLQMSDASSSNNLQKNDSTSGKCFVHARRNFFELLSLWPNECSYILGLISELFANEENIKDFIPEARLAYRIEHSSSILKELNTYTQNLLKNKIVEPNSAMGKAIAYLHNHWEKLTLFIRDGKAPISNNLCERMIKLIVLVRKNSYFYKTESGARVGAVLQSIIQTCIMNGENPYQYLITILANAKKVEKNPKDWLPWNYRTNHSTCATSVIKETVYTPPPKKPATQKAIPKEEMQQKTWRQRCCDFWRHIYRRPVPT